jgi:hypothetical protein
MAGQLGRAPGRPAGPAALLMPAGLHADLWVRWAASRLLWLPFFFFSSILYYLHQNIF